MSYQRPQVDQKIADRARPRAGTPFGDEAVGTCAHPLCSRKVKRHEAFIVTLASDLFCLPCWATVACEDLSRRRA